MFKVILSRQASKDFERIKQAELGNKVKKLIEIVTLNPFQTPPKYEKLLGDLRGYYSRHINNQHRFIYDVLPNTNNLTDENNKPYKGIVHVLRMWTHYE